MHIRATSFTFFQFPKGLDCDDLIASAGGEDDENYMGVPAPIEHCRLKPIGALEMTSAGFVDVVDGQLTAPINVKGEEGIWLATAVTQKILPSAAVNEKLAEKLQEIEDLEGRKPGGRERKRIKDDLLHEMLPQAFSKTKRVNAVIFPKRGLLAVGTAAAKDAEWVVSEIRGVLGSFPAMRLNAEVSPRAVLTGWLAGEPLDDTGLSLGEGAKLVDPVEGGASVTLKDQELRCDEVDKHLESGKQVKSLDLVHEDRSTFSLSEDLVLRKFKVLEAVMDEINDSGSDEEALFQAATMTIVSAEVLQLFDLLSQAFKVTPAQEA